MLFERKDEQKEITNVFKAYYDDFDLISVPDTFEGGDIMKVRNHNNSEYL